MGSYSYDQRLYKAEFALRRLSVDSSYNYSQLCTLESCTNKLKYQILAVAELKTKLCENVKSRDESRVLDNQSQSLYLSLSPASCISLIYM